MNKYAGSVSLCSLEVTPPCDNFHMKMSSHILADFRLSLQRTFIILSYFIIVFFFVDKGVSCKPNQPHAHFVIQGNPERLVILSYLPNAVITSLFLKDLLHIE